MPKQLLRLAGRRTMIQQTLDRCNDWAVPERSWIVTNSAQAPQTAAQLPELPASRLLIEPAARNTAPCIGLAAVRILMEDPDATMFVMPADHVIQPQEAFSSAVRRAAEMVDNDPDQLVLFGVTPTFPSTGYGYIERGESLGSSVPPAYRVASFREKPQQDVAETYIRAGSFYWNCGIFCWKAATILALIKQLEPEMAAVLQRIADGWREGTADSVIASEFPRMKSISIDYAILERARNVAVIEAPFLWDDVGSWLAVPRLNGRDAAGNTIDGAHCGIDTRDCIIRTSDQHLIATLGVAGLIIVHTDDATLVADASQSERIKEVLTQLQQSDRDAWL